MALDWRRDGADWPNRHLSRFVTTRGNRWHVQRGGSGLKVLLIHGAGASTHSWRGLIPLLIPDFEILAPDLPGQGFTTGSPPRFTLPRIGRDLGDLLDAEEFAPDMLIGHSAGAAIALRMALDGCAAPRHILSLNGALTPFEGVAGAVFPRLARLLALNPLTAGIFAATARAPGAVRSLIAGTGSRIDAEGLAFYKRLTASPGHIAATLGMMARWDLGPLLADLPRLTVPVTLALGGRDRSVPPGGARSLAPRFAHATVREFPHFGHLIHEEAPGPIGELVKEIAGVARSKSG